ncbi:MAG TPA: Na+/H+ antiporter NhaA [Pirellulaceae bacterium]|nr:Na+/H+ antiporter NhaA [Pirellulaceae bacterium]
MSKTPASSAAPTLLPDAPVRRWARPLVRFLHIESASGFVLLACAAAAIALANSPWAEAYHAFWHTHLAISLGSWSLDYSLEHWVNDGLMTIFFFVVGLEIKRELVAGELREFRKAALPVMAAIGGMLAPAGIYLLLRHGQPGEQGWGIPMATDIAFVVGALAILGRRVPIGLKILLLALAIVDDLGAVLVIAFFYTSDIALWWLAAAAVGLFAIWLMNGIGVRSVAIYLFVGAAIWLAFVKSGVHPTIAGVMLGLLTPARAWILPSTLQALFHQAVDTLSEHDNRAPQRDMLKELQTATLEAEPPLERLENSLHPWMAFGVMPIFALANAGVVIEPSALGDPIAWSVAAGLVLGKPLGIFVFCWVAVRIGLARLPAGVNWPVLLGAGCLAGIGFTMSLFIASLALEGDQLAAGKIGTLGGSVISAIVGFSLLQWLMPPYVPNDDLNPAEMK